MFGFHPAAQRCSAQAARVVRDAAVAAGAPEHCIQWIEHPSIEATGELMNHPDVATILATGGNAMVRAAYSCGKPALGVGAGNVPAYVEKSANLPRAINDLVLSKSFDNGMVCASEQAVILDTEIYEPAMAEFARLHAHRCNAEEKAALEQLIFGVTAHGENCGGAALNAEIVGQSPGWIAARAGFSVPEDTSILLVEVGSVGRHEPLTREKLCPVLAVLRAEDTEHGITLAEQMVELDGLGHSAAIHTADEQLAVEFGTRVKAVRIIRDSPASLGGIGDVYNAFLPSLTLSCGSYGHNSVSGNVSAVNLINVKRIGRRNNNLQWFKVPGKTFFEPNAIRYLIDLPDVHRVTIVTDATMTRLGVADKIIDALSRRAEQGGAADHRLGRARADRRHRDHRGRADARLPAGHHHRPRWRFADGRRQGDVAALRAPGRGLRRPEGEVLRHPQASLHLPDAGHPGPAGLHPDDLRHRRRGDPVRGDHRSGHRHQVPVGRLRPDARPWRSSTRS